MNSEDLKFWISCAFFILVVYPIKRLVVPILIILKEQAYFLLSLLIGFILIYLYDYDIDRIITSFVTKLSIENSWVLKWLVTPLFFDTAFTTPIIIALFIAIGCSFVNLGIGWIKAFKVVSGVISDGILAILYFYYIVTGNKELSTICSAGKDERRAKFVVYSLVVVLLISVVTFVLLTGKTELQTLLTSTNVLLNVTYPNETANITKMSLSFIPDLPYQNVSEWMP